MVGVAAATTVLAGATFHHAMCHATRLAILQQRLPSVFILPPVIPLPYHYQWRWAEWAGMNRAAGGVTMTMPCW